MPDALTATTTPSTHFDRTTAVRPGAVEGTVEADFDESWTSLRGVHGGYTAAIAVRAAQLSVPDRAVRTISMSFLRPAQVGPAVVELIAVRHGRSLTTLDGAIRQDGRTTSTVRITLTAPADGNDWEGLAVDRPAPLADSVEFTPPPMIRHFGQADMRLDPATVPMGDGSPARIAGHVRPIEPRQMDAAWLTMIGDWFPPSPFRRFAPPTGGVSVDYTVHLHRALAVDDECWLEGVFTAATSHAGLALEHGALATPDGRLVAETFHTRWTA